MQHSRPVNLDLTTIKFPPMAIASILHRITGVILFFLSPFICYFLCASLSLNNYVLAYPLNKLILWGFCAALTYHLLAGIRHLLMDLGIGEGLVLARNSAWMVIIFSSLFAIFLGIWICLRV